EAERHYGIPCCNYGFCRNYLYCNDVHLVILLLKVLRRDSNVPEGQIITLRDTYPKGIVAHQMNARQLVQAKRFWKSESALHPSAIPLKRSELHGECFNYRGRLYGGCACPIYVQ